ncbi:methyl-accepting chemotaxis protein [Conexibacter sp. JD483]|uniref:methyl-accepting chemotaxis protein n=1 Tax=unclassified Conexibacter TaxID=2627773 RepID=UPI00271771FA|nr:MULTISPECIES: methyl-accepting chemotaxis protein [unclassified Conexibacter]MDO8187128.1 methyl-accepting chemotaxis protein [Conexibacter sp. CPCC 205706]MDO8200304.1 methyl-accepting chemotaxis protein [Conexibacter sp. CPCC 205762]MDR9368900.1 methyl-accepting chemotaxis protein [Conexibacter sp. JD483]
MKLTVRTKLLASFLAVVVLMLVVGVVAIAKIGSIHDVNKAYATDAIPSALASAQVEIDANRVRKDQLRHVATLALHQGRGTAAAEIAETLRGDLAEIERDLASATALADEAADRAPLQALRSAWEDYLAASAPAETQAAAGQFGPALRTLTEGPASAAYDRVKAAMVTLHDRQTAHIARENERSESVSSSARTWVIGLLIAAALVSVGLALLLAQQLGNGLRQLLAAARGIAGGDVEQRVEVRSRDELGDTGEAFREMVAYLDEMADAARAIAAGDLAVDVRPKSDRDALGTAFEHMSSELREALGDRSCLEQLTTRMDSLGSNCLSDLETALTAVADGDLTREVHPVTTPIVAEEGYAAGRLAEYFNATLARTQASVVSYNGMRDKVAGMLHEITRESQSVAAASQQMATTSEESGRAVGEIAAAVGEVAVGAERQVRTVEQARLLAEQVVGVTANSSGDAQETAAAAAQAREVAEQGASAIADASDAMEAVQSSSSAVTSTIRSLGEKSDQIGGIVATITGIAEQTNLLALNAAIEAARAGEQGRGFAVVAEEVRKLAEESREAARSIAALISEIQHETGRAVEVVESGAQRTADGVSTVEQARASFLQIGTSVEDMNGRVQLIAGAVAEIADSAGRMAGNMAEVAAVAEQSSASAEQVSASTQQTSASTQEIAASAISLAKTAEELDRLVAQFTLA